MSVNYAIGIGGTGAKAIESLVYLCSMGLGPSTLRVIFVDPDKSNGNLTRTRELISRYNELRAVLGEENIALGLFKTDIKIFTPDTWTIFERAGMTLRDFINYNLLDKKERDAVDILYTQNELDTPLDQGFRGHPAIGALVMAILNKNEAPWLEFWRDMKTTQTAGDFKAFFFGSIFGGTGAAGFPTLTKLVRDAEENQLTGEKRKAVVGGALVLPYFSFNPPTDSQSESAKMFVDISNFPVASKAALLYYFSKELGVDYYYLIGNSFSTNLGEFSIGSATQKNKADVIEMVSALAALDFYSQNFSDFNGANRYFIAQRNKEDLIHWEDLPVPSFGDKTEPASKYFIRRNIYFTTFMHAIQNYFHHEIINNNLKNINSLNWYKNNFEKKKVPLNTADFKDNLTKLQDFSKLFFNWLDEISLPEEVQLFKMNNIKHNWNSNGTAVSNLFSGFAESNHHYTKLIKEFNEQSISEDAKGSLQRLVNLAYKGSEKFSKYNYGLE
ncbi:MAG: hypothetical protein HUU43_07685 [Ignavibacteriaceae bacterium]|nr:hypothetical protein [Ignavibacteriaceae bacterium]